MTNEQKTYYFERWQNYGNKTAETIICDKFLEDDDSIYEYLMSIIIQKYNYIDQFIVNNYKIRIFEKKDVQGQKPEYIVGLYPTTHVFFYCKGLRESLDCIDYLSNLALKLQYRGLDED